MKQDWWLLYPLFPVLLKWRNDSGLGSKNIWVDCGVRDIWDTSKKLLRYLRPELKKGLDCDHIFHLYKAQVANIPTKGSRVVVFTSNPMTVIIFTVWVLLWCYCAGDVMRWRLASLWSTACLWLPGSHILAEQLIRRFTFDAYAYNMYHWAYCRLVDASTVYCHTDINI